MGGSVSADERRLVLSLKNAFGAVESVTTRWGRLPENQNGPTANFAELRTAQGRNGADSKGR